MLISIIVPAFNEEKLLGATLASIQQAAGALLDRGWNYELIVCDNNSKDRTAAIAREAGATVVFEPVNQIARARNTGAAAAKGDWLIFVDADSHPSRELFAEVAGTIASGRCVAGGVTLRLESNHWIGRCATVFWTCVSRMFRLLAGAFIFCEAKGFREVGGFNQELFASEEIDLSRKLKRLAKAQGRKVIVLHRHPMLTSDRKVHLYSLREHLVVVAKAALSGSRSLKDPKHCATWYDGRR